MVNFTKDKKIKRVLILTCSTGEGHNSAAKAIAESLAERGVQCEIFDHLNLKNPQNGKRNGAIYAKIVTKAPSLFGLAYEIGSLYDRLPLPAPVYAANAKYAAKLFAYIKDGKFDCVVCVHLFAMAAMSAVRRKFPLLAPCYAVLTDYTAIPFIKGLSPDGWFVPDGEIKAQFIKRGIYDGDIICSGIPVNPKFNKNLSKTEARNKLGAPHDVKIIAILCGGAGCGRISALCGRLLKTLGGNFKIWVFAGNNKKLKRALEKKFRDSGKVEAVGFTDDMHVRLKAADIALSKTGGLSGTEIAVTGVPFVALQPIRGLEERNFRYFTENGFAADGRKIKRAAYFADKLLRGEAAGKTVKNQARINPGAADCIAEKITERGNIYVPDNNGCG